jgi:carboxyl-terminal processing protease
MSRYVMRKHAWLFALTVLLLVQLPSHDQDLWAAAMDKVESIAEILERDYYMPVSEENLAFSSIRGTLDALDPHSYFLDPTSMSRMKEDYSGKYFGLGIQIQKQGENIVVVAPIEGSPAWRLGMQAGDVISHIEGESTIPLSSFDAMQKLRGEKGTKVTITVVRDGLDKPFDLTITREEIPLLSVPYAFMLDEDTGYVYIRNFGETTPEEFSERLARLKQQGMTSLVLDLRANAGGTLFHCIEVADQFLPAGKLVVSVEGRNPAFNAKLYARRNNQYETLPLVVLIDHGTASASEIVSGAVMDHDRGLIVGEDSWGKGLVQTVFPLASDTAVALTVAKYLTPSGRSIQRDFSHIDDYLLSKKAADEDREIKYTAKGRKVLGQGGITPDYEAAFYIKPLTARLRFLGAFFTYARKLVQHQTDLGKKMVFPEDPDPARTAGTIRVGDSFLMNDAVVEDFRTYLGTLKFEVDAKAFADAAGEIRMDLKREITGAIWGVDAGIEAARKADPVVLKALEVLPEAAKMLDLDPSPRE